MPSHDTPLAPQIKFQFHSSSKTRRCCRRSSSLRCQAVAAAVSALQRVYARAPRQRNSASGSRRGWCKIKAEEEVQVIYISPQPLGFRRLRCFCVTISKRRALTVCQMFLCHLLSGCLTKLCRTKPVFWCNFICDEFFSNVEQRCLRRNRSSFTHATAWRNSS